MMSFVQQAALSLLLAASSSAFSPAGKSFVSTTTSRGMTAQVDTSVITSNELEALTTVSYTEDELLSLTKQQKYLYPRHVEVIEDIAPIANAMVDNILLECGEPSWQPQDFLPDMTKDDWVDEVKDMREQANQIPDDLMVVLVGDMVTEEALPTYQTLLNTFEGCDDPTGTTDGAWAKWSRGWTSEENRHGDLLNKYLYLSGKCDMRAIEVTIQHLITTGFNPEAMKDPYRGFTYTSFQERATKISHGNVGKLAKECGDTNLQRICAKIAGDEARHEKAYQTFCKAILARDPDGLLHVFAELMRNQIVMPAVLMTDGKDPDLYDNFSAVAQGLEVYTALDYAEIIEHLVKTWDLENLDGLSSSAERDREYLCKLPARFTKLAERSMARMEKKGKEETRSFSWINNRECKIIV